MSLIFKEFEGLSKPEQVVVAETVSDFTNGKLGEKPQMLPMEIADVMGKHLGYVAMTNCEFSGYIGAEQSIDHIGEPMSEVGSLYVPKQFRHKGIGHKLVGLVSGGLVAEGVHPYAFCNPFSKNIYLQMGYLEKLADSVPQEAIAACAICPMNPNDGSCCDDILVLPWGIK